jgi:hypothetical protein
VIVEMKEEVENVLGLAGILEELLSGHLLRLGLPLIGRLQTLE